MSARIFALLLVAGLACEAQTEVELEPCDPSVFETELGLAPLGTDCGVVSQGVAVSEREAVRDCMLAAAEAGAPAHATASNGLDSTSEWIVYLRPGEDPPAWGVSYSSDPEYAAPGEPANQVSAYPCTMIAATASCDEQSPAFCIDCVGLAELSQWSCESSKS